MRRRALSCVGCFLSSLKKRDDYTAALFQQVKLLFCPFAHERVLSCEHPQVDGQRGPQVSAAVAAVRARKRLKDGAAERALRGRRLQGAARGSTCA